MRAPKSFAPYIRKVADILRLKDWKIIVAEVPLIYVDDCVVARVQASRVSKQATVWLSDMFLGSDDPEYQRQVITHELIHVHIGWSTDFAGENLKTSDWDSFILFLEIGVDGLADAIAPFMPLPKVKGP